MNSFTRVLSLALLAAFAGCIGTDASLREVGAPARDDGLIGVWKVETCPDRSGMEGTLHQITKDDQGEYFIKQLGLPKSVTSPLRLVELDGAMYVQLANADLVNAKKGERTFLPKYSLPIRLDREGDKFTIKDLHGDKLEQALSDIGRDITLKGGWMTAQCSPDELATLLRRHGAEIFHEEGMTYRRVSEATATDSPPVTQ